MIRISLLIGTLLANSAAFAAKILPAADQSDDQSSYMPIPWEDDDEEEEES